MSGKDVIIDRIVTEAQLKANSTLEEGNKKAQEAIETAQNDARIYKEKYMAESYVERDEIVKRRITVANLEVKKMLLAAKKQVIDNAFDEAAKAVKADKEAYKELIARMLGSAEDGDSVTVAESDKSVFTKKWIIEKAAEYGKKVTVNEKYGNFIGGIMLDGEKSDKNLTLEVELAAVRDGYEPQIADILFGD
jgi:V/A-type H+-transporting ATPase subunit E